MNTISTLPILVLWWICHTLDHGDKSSVDHFKLQPSLVYGKSPSIYDRANLTLDHYQYVLKTDEYAIHLSVKAGPGTKKSESCSTSFQQLELPFTKVT